jgi:hypothetical protein
LILCGQIYGSGFGRHGPTKARRGLGPGRTTVFILRAGTARPKSFLGFPGPNPFDTKHDWLERGWPGPAQFPSLGVGAAGLSIYDSLTIIILIFKLYSTNNTTQNGVLVDHMVAMCTYGHPKHCFASFYIVLHCL